jgi:hypothetical protein
MKSWRYVQLENRLCDQDKVILNLFQDRPVKYVGNDKEFALNLNLDINSTSTIAIFNHSGWFSDLIDFVHASVVGTTEFYVGINRYCLLGNDTQQYFKNGNSDVLIDFIKSELSVLGYIITQSGFMDNDKGRYFNFVQPLTWVYGTNKSN